MEKLVLATEEIFLVPTDAKQCMDTQCLKLVEYLRRRNFETGLVLLSEETVPDETVQETLNFYIPAQEVFRNRSFNQSTKYFIDNSAERLEKAADQGFIPVLITERQATPSFTCQAFPSISDFHLSLIRANFETE
ncbi:hypothetical protein [Enterococcus sp. AZ109]|uniref:hypothetical protein n=1 Tax=Enterococcus sp. AZ109 TaxID=2774634 RepID=UPI003F23EF8A